MPAEQLPIERTAEELAEAARPESRIREVLRRSPGLMNAEIAKLLEAQGVVVEPEDVYRQRKILGLC